MNVQVKQFYTYLHCKPNGEPFYVGKGCNQTRARKRSHNFSSRSIYHKRVVEKYGKKNISIFVFNCDSEQQAFNDEMQQIAQFRREGYILCNHTNGGEGASGRVFSHTIQSREKISASHKGKVIPNEVRIKLSNALKGKSKTPEHSAKVGAKQKGKVISETTKLKISLKMKGKPWTEARRLAQNKRIGICLPT